MKKWSRDELEYIVKRTRDPSTLPPGMLDQMEAAKVGPFAYDEGLGSDEARLILSQEQRNG